MALEDIKASSVEERTQRQILQLIVKQDDVSWKNIIFGLIESQQMDPWDINISLLAAGFLDQLKKLKEMDFRISGKVVLASAVLLKLKAEKLRDEELEALDSIIRSAEEPVDLGLDELQSFEEPYFGDGERPQLVPRTPQPRKRKVSVYDLVEALEKALEADARRPAYVAPRTLDTIDPPEHHIDISVIIREVYDRVYGHYELDKNDGNLMFHHIVRSSDPRDMVMAFIPLLHLENARKVEMEQPEHFGPIAINLIDRTPPAFLKETQTRLDADTSKPSTQMKLEYAHEAIKEMTPKKPKKNTKGGKSQAKLDAIAPAEEKAPEQKPAEKPAPQKRAEKRPEPKTVAKQVKKQEPAKPIKRPAAKSAKPVRVHKPVHRQAKPGRAVPKAPVRAKHIKHLAHRHKAKAR